MKKSELIERVCKLYPFLTEQQATDIVSLVFSSLSQGLAQGKRIEIRGFGSFTPKKRKVQLKFTTQRDKIELGERGKYFSISVGS